MDPQMNAIAKYYYKRHKSSVGSEDWTAGEPVKSWRDWHGVLCIEYQSGQWWHYKETKNGFEWW